VAAPSVVVLQPGRKCRGAFGIADEDLSVGPLGLQGAVQALDLAVLPWAVWLDELLRDGEVIVDLVANTLEGSENQEHVREDFVKRHRELYEAIEAGDGLRAASLPRTSLCDAYAGLLKGYRPAQA
jgi:hypothetical protein